MGNRIVNRAKATVSAAPGTGAFALSAAVANFQAFPTAGVIDGDTIGYLAEGAAGVEVGIGTYAATGATLARTTILFSTNGGAAVNFGADVTVTATIVASDLIPSARKVTARFSQVLTTAIQCTASTMPAAGSSGTAPTTSNGTQVLSLSVTTTSATQRVQLRLTGFLVGSTTNQARVAIFRGSTLIRQMFGGAATNTGWNVGLEHDDAPGAAGTYTYTVRCGLTSDYSSFYCTFNGYPAAVAMPGGVGALFADVYEP